MKQIGEIQIDILGQGCQVELWRGDHSELGVVTLPNHRNETWCPSDGTGEDLVFAQFLAWGDPEHPIWEDLIEERQWAEISRRAQEEMFRNDPWDPPQEWYDRWNMWNV